MPAESPLLSIVVPAFNERATIEALIGKLRDALVGWRYEVIIVDDCSTDGTAESIGRLNSEQVHTLRHDRNQGKGAALRTGFKQAAGDIIVVQDADLEYDPVDIPVLVQPIVDGHADVVYGSRFRGRAQ